MVLCQQDQCKHFVAQTDKFEGTVERVDIRFYRSGENPGKDKL
jgi:hypothetical protein